MSSISEVSLKLKELLDESVSINLCEGILLSGGLDTSIIAMLAAKRRNMRGVTVSFGPHDAPDVKYSQKVASMYKIEHNLVRFGEDELYDAVRHAVRTMRSFDPMEIRNSASIVVALKTAKENGIREVMTGDGGDELFAGYSFLFKLKGLELQDALERMWRVMSFSTTPLAQSLGLRAYLPMLHEPFKNYAMSVDPSLKVKEEHGQTWGKWILRKAFENELPEELVWRVKMPIEVGSGTSVLGEFFEKKIPDKEMEEKRSSYLSKDGVRVRDKERLFYYETFRREFGVPGRDSSDGKECPDCHSSIQKEGNHCRTCGAYPV